MEPKQINNTVLFIYCTIILGILYNKYTYLNWTLNLTFSACYYQLQVFCRFYEGTFKTFFLRSRKGINWREHSSLNVTSRENTMSCISNTLFENTTSNISPLLNHFTETNSLWLKYLRSQPLEYRNVFYCYFWSHCKHVLNRLKRFLNDAFNCDAK